MHPARYPRRLALFLVLVATLAAAVQAGPPPAPASAPGRVLIALTSHDRLGETGRATGYYLAEVSHPYFQFLRAGLAVDLVSPRGGKAPMDPHSLDQPDGANTRFLENSESAAMLENTRKASEVDPAGYVAILFAGGHGVMWDFPDDPDLARIAMDVYARGGVVAAVCHGPAGIVNLRLPDGSFLVAGKEVSTFTNEEEELVQLTDVMPFLLEDTLRARGARITKAAPWQAHVVTSERLVTGQNPASAGAVAGAVVELLLGRGATE